jgi:hypothetical protein
VRGAPPARRGRVSSPIDLFAFLTSSIFVMRVYIWLVPVGNGAGEARGMVERSPLAEDDD